MGKLYETSSSYRGSNYRGSSYRGTSYRGSSFRGVASSYRGRGGFGASRATTYSGRVDTNRHEATRPSASAPKADARHHLNERISAQYDARTLLPRSNNNSNPKESREGRHETRGDSARVSARGSRTLANPNRSGSRGRMPDASRRAESGKEIYVTVPGLSREERGSARERSRRDEQPRQIKSSSRDQHRAKSHDRKSESTSVTVSTSGKYKGSGEMGGKRARERSDSGDYGSGKMRSASEKSERAGLKFEPIKIQITNSNYVPPMASNVRSDDSMDYESSGSEYEAGGKYGKMVDNPVKSNLAPHHQQQQQQQHQQQQPSSTSVLGLTPVAAALLQNSGLNAFNSSYKPAGLLVNSFPAAGMYGAGYDRLWNPGQTGFYNNSSNSNACNAKAASVNEMKADPVPGAGTKSSKDGYKLLVSNLHPKVSEDDVLELFSDIGPIKRARFIDKGLAEVIYVRIEHAKEAIQKYDLKELDGRQMVIGFADKSHLTSSSDQQLASTSAFSSQIPPSSITNGSIYQGSTNPSYMSHSKTIENSPSYYQGASNKLSQQPPAVNTLSDRFKAVTKEHSSMRIPESKHIDKNQSVNHVDSSIIHQVLFKQAPITNGKPVTFTVKL